MRDRWALILTEDFEMLPKRTLTEAWALTLRAAMRLWQKCSILTDFLDIQTLKLSFASQLSPTPLKSDQQNGGRRIQMHNHNDTKPPIHHTFSSSDGLRDQSSDAMADTQSDV